MSYKLSNMMVDPINTDTTLREFDKCLTENTSGHVDGMLNYHGYWVEDIDSTANMDCDDEVDSENDEDTKSSGDKFSLKKSLDITEDVVQQAKCNSPTSMDCSAEVGRKTDEIDSEGDENFSESNKVFNESVEAFSKSDEAFSEGDEAFSESDEVGNESDKYMDSLELDKVFLPKSPDINENLFRERSFNLTTNMSSGDKVGSESDYNLCSLQTNIGRDCEIGSKRDEDTEAIEHDEISLQKRPDIASNTDTNVYKLMESTKSSSRGVQTDNYFDFMRCLSKDVEKKDSSVQVEFKEINDLFDSGVHSHESSSPSLNSSIPDSFGNLPHSSSEKLSNKEIKKHDIKSRGFSYNISSGSKAVNCSAKKLQSSENGSLYWIQRAGQQKATKFGSGAVKDSSLQNSLHDHRYDELDQCDTIFSCPLFTPNQSSNNSSIESMLSSKQCSKPVLLTPGKHIPFNISRKIPELSSSSTGKDEGIANSSVPIERIVYDQQFPKMETHKSSLASGDYSYRFLSLEQLSNSSTDKFESSANKMSIDYDQCKSEHTFHQNIKMNKKLCDLPKRDDKRARIISAKYKYNNFIEPVHLKGNIKGQMNNSAKAGKSLFDLVSRNYEYNSPNRPGTSTEKIAPANTSGTSTAKIAPVNKFSIYTEKITSANGSGTLTVKITPSINSTLNDQLYVPKWASTK